MTTLNDLYLDDYGSLCSKTRLDSKEWDVVLKELFEDWVRLKKGERAVTKEEIEAAVEDYGNKIIGKLSIGVIGDAKIDFREGIRWIQIKLKQ